MIETAEAAATSTTSMLQRMRELAVQAANGTYSSSDRVNLNAEFGNLTSEIDRVANVTKWNGTTLGDGNKISIQVGSGTSNNVVTVSTKTLTTAGLGVDASTITSIDSAVNAISDIDTALSSVATARADLGARINRFQFTVDQLTSASTNFSQSESRIEDTDYSQATSVLAKTQVLQQAGTAMLAQANQQPNSVLSLLK
jgi:flagellin